MLYLLSVGLHYVLFAIQQSQAVEQRLAEAKLLARDAELRALKTQINPHFLFNSLHSISALTSIDPSRARDMCVALADFLRLTLGMGEKAVIPLEEELSLLRKYLAVEKIRFGARLRMEEDVDLEVLRYTVPPLLLQPLIENAVSHGIANLPEGGWIKLAVHRDGDDRMHLAVANNYDPDTPPRRRSGVGLVNVRQRMEARYGKRAQFAINKVDDRFEVIMEIPAETLENA
jgi:LytS/YehU family sensor histidine kinase